MNSVKADTAIDLHGYKHISCSQYGENGILAALFKHKGIKNGYFCEFGAWDGQHLSNTYAMYEKGWQGCYIEGPSTRYEDLKRNINKPGVALVCAFVMPAGENCLDEILKRNMPAGRELDLLSIDIDSDDLAIWKSLKQVRPKVVCIDFNPTIPIDVRHENPKGKNRGNYPLSIWEFGVSQGYELVAATHCNLIMIDAKFNDGTFRVFNRTDLGPNRGFKYFFRFDWTMMVTDPETGAILKPELFVVPWNNTVFPPTNPAHLPPFRRRSDELEDQRLVVAPLGRRAPADHYCRAPRGAGAMTTVQWQDPKVAACWLSRHQPRHDVQFGPCHAGAVQ